MRAVLGRRELVRLGVVTLHETKLWVENGVRFGFRNGQDLQPREQQRISPGGPRVDVDQPDSFVRGRDVDVKDEVVVREVGETVEKVLDLALERAPQLEEKLKVVHLALADGDEFAVPHKAPKLQRRVEVERFPKDKVVRHVGLVHAAVKGMLEVVGDEVAGLEEEVDVVGRPTFQVVGGCDPGRVLRSGPVQLRHDFAPQFGNRGANSLVDVGPRFRGIFFVVLILKPAVLVVGGVFGRQDDPIGPQVLQERLCERYEPRLRRERSEARVP